jgi:hypothetical protein
MANIQVVSVVDVYTVHQNAVSSFVSCQCGFRLRSDFVRHKCAWSVNTIQSPVPWH